MLREIADGAPAGWAHAEEWAERLRRWAAACERLLVLSPDAVRRVPDLLGVPSDKVVWAPNGFDPAGFRREPLGPVERLAHWRRWLVKEPRGWDESGEPGSVAYSDEQLEPLRAGQAHPAPDPRPCARESPLRGAGPARAARRHPRRVGGRAPPDGRARD